MVSVTKSSVPWLFNRSVTFCLYLQNLLKEKLELEQDSKKFFKEHCRKAEQEIHRLNLLRQQELEERMNSEKKTLEQLV